MTPDVQADRDLRTKARPGQVVHRGGRQRVRSGIQWPVVPRGRALLDGVGVDAVFVGRQRELARLQAQLDQAALGAPSVVLVEGIAGAGKSALLRRWLAAADAVTTLWVSGDEEETAVPFGVHHQLLTALADPGAAARVELSDRWSSMIPSGDLQTTGEHLRARLHAASSCRPCVLVVDDAHLADRPSLTALNYALRRLRNELLLIVFAVRPEGVDRLPTGVLKLVDALGTRVELRGLSLLEIRELTLSYGQGPISDRTARRLYEHTGGSPLYLRALLSDQQTDTQDWLDAPLPAPQGFSRLVAGKIAQAAADTRGLAQATAVLGVRADLRRAAAVAGLADPLTAVDELHRLGLARLSQTRDRTELVLEHVLIRTALLETCGPARLAVLHLAAAEVTQGAESLFHRAQAAGGPEPEVATQLADLARRDVARGSWRTAANALLEAARLHDRQESRDAALIYGVYALLVAGDLAVARTYRGRIADLPASPRRAQVQALIAWQEGNFAEAEAVAAQGWSAVSELEPLERDRMAGLIAQMCIWQGRSVEALEWSESALRSGLLDSRGRAMTLATLVGAMALEGRAAEALELLPTDGDLDDAGYRELVGMRGILEMLCDDPATAAGRLRIRLRPNLSDHKQAQTPFERLTATGPDGIEPNKMMVLLFLADAEFRNGNWDVAAAIADQVVALSEDTDQDWIAPWAHAAATMVPASRGEWTVAEAHLASAEQEAARVGGEFNHVYVGNAAAHLASCRGDSERVVAAAEALVQQGKAFRAEPGLYCWPVHYAEALVALRRDSDAEEVIGEWETIALARGRRSRMAAFTRIRGDLATRRRDLAAARAAYEEAMRVGDGACDAMERALLFSSRGRFLRRRGERRAAIRDLDEAARRFRALAAAPFLDAVHAELAACGVEPDSDRTRAVKTGLLTSQETAVARLVSAGLSNREIADLLVLSPKTVSYHLGHVYAKLQVRTRTELASRYPSLT